MKKILLTMAFSALAIGYSNANLVLNGSFEDPAIAGGTWQIGGIAGWYSTVGDGGEIQNHAAGTPFDGNQLLELDGNQNSNLLQDIPTLLGGQYSLSFQYSPRPGISAASNPVEIYLGGILLDTLTGDGAGDTVWSLHEYDVVTGGPATLEFRAAGVSDRLGGYIDDVQLNAQRNTVPESGSTIGLLAVGLMGLQVIRRKLKA